MGIWNEKSDYDRGREDGEERDTGTGIGNAHESFANQTNPFTSEEYKDGFEDGLDKDKDD